MDSRSGTRATKLIDMVRRPSLQTCLIALVLLVLVPTLGVVGMTLLRTGQSYRDASSQQLLETAHVVAQSVTSELEATSRLLAGYAALQQTDVLGGGSMQTNALLEGQTGVTLITKQGSGFKVVSGASDEIIDPITLAAISTGEAAVSNIVMSSLAGDMDPRIVVAVPGRHQGDTTEVVSLITRPSSLIRSLERQGAAAGGAVLAITDGTGHIIGRSLDPDKFIGRPVPDWQTLVDLGTSSGTFQARTIEGADIIFGFQKIQGTPGWVAVVGEPLTAFNDRWQQPITVMIVASAATIMIAFALAMLLARRILRPIKNLALRARTIAEGDDPTEVDVPPSFVAEFETLRQSLDGAEVALRVGLQESRIAGQASQKNYEALQQAERLARIGSWTLDLATGEFTSSEMLYHINGLDPAGPPLKAVDLEKLMTPESYERIRAAIAECSTTGEAYGMEVHQVRTNGTQFAAFVRGQAIRDEAGKIVRIAGTVQDISERQEVRERLAALADNLPNGAIYRLERDLDGAISVTYISAGIEQLVGISPAEILSSRSPFLNAILPEDRPGYHAALEHSLHTGDVFDYAFRVITRDERQVWMHTRSALRRQPNGWAVWDGIVRDITGEREAAEILRTAKDTAEAAERSKSDFLATMSHEIRTPMNTVVGMTRLTLQTELAPKQRNYLEKIDASARVLLGIINDILDFSKIEAGGLELEDTVFTLDSVLESVSALTAMRAEEKALEIAFAIAPDTPSLLRGDSLRLGQVLTNLVSNAVKFTEAGEVVISIAPAPTEQSPAQLQFCVRDTGIGLDADQIAGLFQPFSQANSDTSRKYGGTGLGLAICKRLVELMGGQIWVESTPGQGSSFFFTVTLEPVHADIAPDTTAHPSNYLRDRRILIVDDNASARDVLADMVSQFGMQAQTATSGQEALTLLRSEASSGKPFDIVLMDWRMPDMDGLETARRIRSDASLEHMPAVLMVTAYGREEVMHGAEQIGLEGVLIKPVTQSVMFNTVLGILSRSTPHHAVKALAPLVSEDALFAALQGRRVLVVDDNALNREVAGDFLSLAGVSVETAVDGRDALAMLELHDFDVVLMDMHMPVMDGLTAVREIRKQTRWANLPVIALTAQARVEDHHASQQAGMTAHLTKPIDEKALYRTMVDVLAAHPAPANSNGDDAKPDSDFDLAATLLRFGGKTERVERLLRGFLRDFSDAPQLLDQHLEAADFEQVAALSHLLKGSAGYFGQGQFQAAADRLELAARQRQPETALTDARLFRTLLERLLDDVRNGLASLPAPSPTDAPLQERRS